MFFIFCVKIAGKCRDGAITIKIELTNWTSERRAELCQICNHVDRRYLSNRIPCPYTPADADWWLEQVIAKEGSVGVFRAIAADGQYAGSISVERKEDVYSQDAEIGYMLLDSFRSKGIMTQAVSQICDIAFSQLNIARITGLVYAPNTASRRVLEKNGFSLEGIMKNAVSKNACLYDLCIYGKLRY